MNTFISSSSAETRKFAKALAKKFAHRGSHAARRTHALVIALQGELGSGKTTFVQGFFRGLGLRRRAMSPTFILFRRVALHDTRYYKNLYHVDCYRIKTPRELLRHGFAGILRDPTHIVLIEWADKVHRI
ncbi:MAG: tRNA (adenosine(37)-N6)-threonylcarbamoyltransferase complex ATPase subunit type 1 TsaE, partial [Candidatus Liptonbacteria bacterium]|nr:tRNA (adenosine(37)-N6)-threonylcarbamoyltransferase complex ATPase subunit type 1 TsaE [Candidatus Liptonbacteria bacterium]